MSGKPFKNSRFSASTRVSRERVLDRVPKMYQKSSFSTRRFEVIFFLILFYLFFDPGLRNFFFDPFLFFFLIRQPCLGMFPLVLTVLHIGIPVPPNRILLKDCQV